MNIKLYPQTFEEFAQLAQHADVVPVIGTISTHSFNAIDLFIKLSQAARYAFLFESVEGEERVAQYSFVGADPYMIVRGRGDQTIVERANSVETLRLCAADFIKDHFRQRQLARTAERIPLAGGAVGYLAYNAAGWFEPAIGVSSSGADQPDDGLWMFFRSLVVFDHKNAEVKLVAVVFKELANQEPESLQMLYEDAIDQTGKLCDLLQESSAPLETKIKASPPANSGVNSNWTKEGFCDAVNRVKEYILAGDCYQAVLSQRFSRPVSAEPVAIYRALRQSNPSPYMYFLKLDGDSIIGASPEMLVRIRGKQIEYRPIAGTRPRGVTETEDEKLSEEMRCDEKEIAEHTMLVDLGRNDVGRVAEFGSVTVDQLMSVERYSKVQHLVSSLSAQLRSDCDRFDALAACFPAGTVTGAPKVKAMEIIKVLEPEPRNVYAGSIFYLDYAGNLDSCIAIRTIELRNGQASVQAGAGIVSDSIPEREYAETVAKADGLWRAIEMAENESTPDLQDGKK